MNRHRWIAVLALLLLLAACATVPYTHRSQLLLVGESQELALGADAYREVLRQQKIVHDPKLIDPVRRVGERIARVANRSDYRWEFNVIDDDKQINAFALPGGKVAVYTGLFPVARDTGGLAAVLGHEVAHALARHAGERMSQGMLLQIAATGLAVGLGDQSPTTQQAIMQAFGLGAQVGVLLPFGRSQEAEADHIGLILMAKAGYDPGAALDLWQRFEQAGKGGPPEFLSTHPSYGTRQKNISSWLAEARGYLQAGAAVQIEPLPAVH
jgi:predicted Zn-dependent protease